MVVKIVKEKEINELIIDLLESKLTYVDSKIKEFGNNILETEKITNEFNNAKSKYDEETITISLEELKKVRNLLVQNSPNNKEIGFIDFLIKYYSDAYKVSSISIDKIIKILNTIHREQYENIVADKANLAKEQIEIKDLIEKFSNDYLNVFNNGSMNKLFKVVDSKPYDEQFDLVCKAGNDIIKKIG